MPTLLIKMPQKMCKIKPALHWSLLGNNHTTSKRTKEFSKQFFD